MKYINLLATITALLFSSSFALAQNYQELVNRPDAYIGKYIRLSGKVAQAAPAPTGGGWIMRINITNNRADIWTDTIWVDLNEASAGAFGFSEGQLVEIDGKYVGVKTYTAVSGTSISLPHIVACSARAFRPGYVTAPKPC